MICFLFPSYIPHFGYYFAHRFSTCVLLSFVSGLHYALPWLLEKASIIHKYALSAVAYQICHTVHKDSKAWNLWFQKHLLLICSRHFPRVVSWDHQVKKRWWTLVVALTFQKKNIVLCRCLLSNLWLRCPVMGFSTIVRNSVYFDSIVICVWQRW